MSDETTTETTEVDNPPANDEGASVVVDSPDGGVEPDDTPEDTFPREVVEELRKENAKYRQRAGQADELAKRLHTELVRATGRLADPTDLPFDEDHLADAEKLVAAIDELLDAKPHLATRKPAGDIGQGNRGGTAEPFSLLGLLKERT